jgi:hypothetical protein
MKFAEFSSAYQSAKEQLQGFEGDDNFPGLTVHDRAYALPVDWQGEEYTAVVRACRLTEHESSPIPVMIWHWHWRRAQEVDLSKLAPDQLAALAEIKRVVRWWIEGKIAELPPSTCRHFSAEDSCQEGTSC